MVAQIDDCADAAVSNSALQVPRPTLHDDHGSSAEAVRGRDPLPAFQELNRTLASYLREVTDRVIAQGIDSNMSEVDVAPACLPAAGARRFLNDLAAQLAGAQELAVVALARRPVMRRTQPGFERRPRNR